MANMELGSQPSPVYNEPPKKRGGKVLTILLFLILLVAAGGLGYLYWKEMDKSANLQKQLDNAPETTQTDDTQQAEGTQASFTATVGKFTLTLPKDYYIVVDLDGPFEGGPVTKLSVARVDSQHKQTVTSASHETVSIQATPMSGTFEESVTNALSGVPEESRKKLEPVTVSGVAAEVYEIDGLFKDKKLFLTKNNIFYVITAGNATATDSLSQKTLDEVIKGIKFNE